MGEARGASCDGSATGGGQRAHGQVVRGSELVGWGPDWVRPGVWGGGEGVGPSLWVMPRIVGGFGPVLACGRARVLRAGAWGEGSHPTPQSPPRLRSHTRASPTAKDHATRRPSSKTRLLGPTCPLSLQRARALESEFWIVHRVFIPAAGQTCGSGTEWGLRTRQGLTRQARACVTPPARLVGPATQAGSREENKELRRREPTAEVRVCDRKYVRVFVWLRCQLVWTPLGLLF